MVPPLAGIGPADEDVAQPVNGLTSSRLVRVRAILFSLTVFFGLVAWVFNTLGPAPAHGASFLVKLRDLGLLTWVYALVQLIDLRFYNSRFAQRRRATLGIPDSLHAWLFGQLLASFGIVYYALTQDPRWFAAGVAILFVSFAAFPVRDR